MASVSLSAGRAAALAIGALAAVALLFWITNDPSQPSQDPQWITDDKPGNHLHGIGYDAEGDRLFLATHFGLFVHDGTTLLALSDPDDFMGFSLHPQDPQVMYASGHPQGGGNAGVLRSDDGGATWTQVHSGPDGRPVDFHAMAVSAADPDVVAGWTGGLFVSEDAGATWRTHDLPGGECWGAACLAFDPQHRERIYAGTQEGLLVSDDLGATWATLHEGPHAGVAMVDGTLFAFSLEAGLRTFDGADWQDVPFGSGAPVFAFAMDARAPSTVFAATLEGSVHRSQDGGATWHAHLP